MITLKEFGVLPTGETVYVYRIENKNKEYVELLNYGAAIHAVCIADRDGNIDDIVLGAAEGSDLTQCNVLGSTIGRCANRIAHGRYEADGKTHQLEQNARGHFLHGASGNYAKKIFSATVDEEKSAVVFSCLDTGDGGFDCNVSVRVRYSFGDDRILTMETTMIPDGTTICNPTNHTYFNLGVEDTRQLHLKLRAKYRVSRDDEGLPDGGKLDVRGTSADFTVSRSIGSAMDTDLTDYFGGKIPGYDEFYILDQKPGIPAAELYCPENGRIMLIETDMPSLVLYSIENRKNMLGKNGKIYSGYCSVCLEPGFVPNAVNCEQYDSPIYRKGEVLRSVTKYIFKTDQQ